MDPFHIISTATVSAGIAYGVLHTRIETLREKAKETANYSERLAAIEAKLDILLNNTYNHQ